ncbi:MAG: hypothetical protein LBT00_13445 [Spirochaetaceae bacterium]|nr:hypothetical protein [Spirochaetaceae bacterium]
MDAGRSPWIASLGNVPPARNDRGHRHCEEAAESSLRGRSPKQSRRGRPPHWIASLRSQ